MNLADLQELIAVSPATLRRDLTELENSGELIRVHGGVMAPAYARNEISFDERLRRNNAAKKAIATSAAALIPAGSTVFIDAGSTCLEAGKLLLARKDVKVITHSIALVAAAAQAEAHLICIGGELRKVSGALVGANAIGALGSLHADFAFIGASAMNHEGCWTTELTEAELKQAILARATRQVLLADSSKWDGTSTVRFASWNLLTDWILSKRPSFTKRERAALQSVTIRASLA